jgi:hypothetical protein
VKLSPPLVSREMREKPAQDEPTRGRLAYLDNLKVLLVAGMIGVHVAIIYGRVISSGPGRRPPEIGARPAPA